MSTTTQFREPVPCCPGEPPSTARAFDLWKALERRLRGFETVEQGVMDLPLQGEDDPSHFELTWKATGRDSYRFTVW